MTLKQIAKNRMYKRVLGFLNANTAFWAAFLRLVSQITTFTDANTTLDSFIDQQAKTSSGFTGNKNVIFTTLISDTVKAARKGLVYAIDQGNEMLIALFSVRVYDLNQIPQDVALANIQNIYDGINQLAAKLLPYSITADDVTAISDGIAAFKTATPGTGNARAAKKAATKGIADTMVSIDASLGIMDDLIINGIDDTGLVNEYRNNRKTDTVGRRYTGIVAVIDTAKGSAIAGATMTIAALNKNAVSNLLGMAEIISMKPGMYEVTFTAAGFAPQTLILTIARGVKLEVNINLVPLVQEMELVKVA